jgi:hypothetical protein
MTLQRRLGRAPPYFAKSECGFLPKAATRMNSPGLGILMESSGYKDSAPDTNLQSKGY